MVHLRILLCLGKFADHRTRQVQFPCYGPLAQPLFHEGAHVLIESRALVSSDLLLKVVVPHPFRPLVGKRRAGSVVFLWFC